MRAVACRRGVSHGCGGSACWLAVVALALVCVCLRVHGVSVVADVLSWVEILVTLSRLMKYKAPPHSLGP